MTAVTITINATKMSRFVRGRFKERLKDVLDKVTEESKKIKIKQKE